MEAREEDLLLAKAEQDVPASPPTASNRKSTYFGAACIAATLLGAAVVASGSTSRSSGVVELKGKHGSSGHSSKKVTGSIDFSVANRLVLP